MKKIICLAITLISLNLFSQEKEVFKPQKIKGLNTIITSVIVLGSGQIYYDIRSLINNKYTKKDKETAYNNYFKALQQNPNSQTAKKTYDSTLTSIDINRQDMLQKFSKTRSYFCYASIVLAIIGALEYNHSIKIRNKASLDFKINPDGVGVCLNF